MSLALRWQHGLLAVSITLLLLTGLPLRFAQADSLRQINGLFGGLAGGRLVHRGAAVVLILTWMWHLGWLLLRWHRAGYSLSSWTMWPTRKDVSDFVLAAKDYLGLANEEPKFDRYGFRNKLDYLAEYWGMPVMVLSGLVLWFPIYFGNRLPETALSFAYIAHGYEATLAFLAIITWHLYNAHFSPDRFPMSPVFYTGTMTRAEMEDEHPLELERLERSPQLTEGEPKPMDGDAKPMEGEPQPMEREAQLLEGEAQPLEREAQLMEGEAKPMEGEAPAEPIRTTNGE
jgi:cytochrome b subunit of formate dehydrogenase